MLAASCQDTEFAEAVDSSKAQVMFSIAMDSPAARSRANWGQDYSQTSDLGDEYDNRIDLDQFIVKIEAGGKTYNVTDIIKWKEGETNEHKFVGIVKTQNGENVGEVTLQKAKISVYANMGNDANANFAGMTFNYDAKNAANIPMWGALTVENLKFAPGKRTSVDDIYLLRAMAKFQVTLGEDAIEKGYTLTKASLNKFNLVGNNMPTGYADATSTMALGMEEVMNENTSNLAGATELTIPTEDGNGWVIYLPEISNTTASELKMILTFSKEGQADIASEVSVKDYTTANTGLVNIVRNHWYKYVIEDIVNAKPVVEYEALSWEPIDITVGGEGYLYLNKNVIKMYNTNIDTDQLKFSSSSPIESIKLVDSYNHAPYIDKFETYIDGTPEDAKDHKFAYYVNKFGNKIQLGTDPDFTDSQEFENQILKAITASYPTNENNGGIEIYSPFIADQNFNQDSHYNAVRYLEFEVTNQQGYVATFRVEQYPAIKITNVEGFYSYRDDFCQGHRELGTNTEPVHYQHIAERAYILASYNNGDIHQVDPNRKDSYGHDYVAITTDFFGRSDGAKQGDHFKEMLLIDGGPGYYHKAIEYPYGEIERTKWGKYFPQSSSNPTIVVGPPYQDFNYVIPEHQAKSVYSYAYSEGLLNKVREEGNDFWWRKHFSGNLIEIFASKVIYKIYRDGIENNGKGYRRLPGQADLYYHFPNAANDGWDLEERIVRISTMPLNNNRMYHVKTLIKSDDITIGYPKMVNEVTGKEDNEYGVVELNGNNHNLVSPSFMIASQLGETESPVEDNPKSYYDPTIDFLYYVAKVQCREYVETTFEDNNGNGIPEPELGEKVEHYHNWRLPTKKELERILIYQKESRAMDLLLTGEKYFCVTDDINEPFIVNPDYTEGGYHIRCVRDVKPNPNDSNE